MRTVGDRQLNLEDWNESKFWDIIDTYKQLTDPTSRPKSVVDNTFTDIYSTDTKSLWLDTDSDRRDV